MKLAVVAAGFTPGEADQLRRAMGKWRKTGIINQFHEKLINGMKARGLTGEFAEQVFRQISGFGEYGFPESHAASFAKLVYVSAWLKHYYPAAFCASIINSLPMGFYAPAQLVADAKAHGVEVLPVDVNHSQWDCTIEHGVEDDVIDSNILDDNRQCERQGASRRSQAQMSNQPAAGALPLTSSAKGPCRAAVSEDPQSARLLRLGLRMISGLRADVAQLIVERRRAGKYTSVSDFTRRTKLGQAVVAQLSKADAFGSVNQDRRAALWQALGQEKKAKDQPLFAGLETHDDDTFALPTLAPQDEVTEDYRSIGLSLRAHPISFQRMSLDQLNVTCCGKLTEKPNNRQLRVAGLVILRQRPQTAKGITFVTLEDETGTANLIVKQGVWKRYYKIARRSPAWIAHGKLEMKSGITHVIVNRIEDMSCRLDELQIKSRDFR